MALFPTLWLKVWFCILLSLIYFCPSFLSRFQLSILNEMAIAMIGALGLNLLTGFTGQISLGHGAFLAIGAYTTALLTSSLGIPFIISVPLSGGMAALLGMVVGVPSLRLKGLYLALGTLAFGFIINYVIFHWDLTKGDIGMAVEKINFFNFHVNSEKEYFYFFSIMVIIATLCAKNLARSKIGRSFIAIRDRDIAAETMGIPIAKYKIIAFGICAFYGGIAGAMAAHYKQWIVPGNFDLSLSIGYIAMIVLGGLGSILGSILGAVLITGIPYGIMFITDALRAGHPGISGSIVDLKIGIFGLIIILALRFEPKGLAGVYQRIKLYWKTWPFKY